MGSFDAIADELRRLGARAREIGLIGEHDNGPSITFAPDHVDIWYVTMVTYPTIAVLRGGGSTPSEALAAFSAVLYARSPDAGWATLGVDIGSDGRTLCVHETRMRAIGGQEG